MRSFGQLEHHFAFLPISPLIPSASTAYGNVSHLEFTLDAFPGNPLGHLQMSQWMYLEPDSVTMLNRATHFKTGIVVAQITEQFRKDR